MMMRIVICSLVMSLSACGGSGTDPISALAPSVSSTDASNASTTTASPTVLASVPTTGSNTSIASIKSIEVAQTHLMPPQGLQWTQGTTTHSLRLTANRETLVLVEPGASDLTGAKLEVLKGGVSLGQLALSSPNTLPQTEDGGKSYSTTAWHARIPANLVQPGISIRIASPNIASPLSVALAVGPDTSFEVRILPFYLFGANSSNSVALAQTSEPDASTKADLAATWPMANLSITNHPAQSVSWPYLVVPPRSGRAAYRIQNKDEQIDTFDGMVATLGIMQGMRSANGEGSMSLHYYAPMMMLDSLGAFKRTPGGYGGGSAGAGIHTFEGVFIHELGHAFGLGHAGESYTNGTYPYAGGSLKGSQWAWDSLSNIFRSPFVAATAANRSACTSSSSTRQFDAQARCFKQDPMQSGDGDQPAGVRYAMFSDFSLARMQNYMETRLHPDAAFASGFKTWNTSTQTWKEASTATIDSGLNELDGGIPAQRGVPVHTVVVSFSKAGSANASQIYSPISYTGNLPRTIDPTSAAQRASINPSSGANAWYCKASGCDYTLRVTYADGSLHHAVINKGFRQWFSDTFKAGMSDASSSDSFRLWVLNVPGAKAIQKIEVLDTPKAWLGMPTTEIVVVQRSL